MAGNVTITDRITRQDFRNLAAFGVRVKVLLDLSHAESEKPIHLDITLDFSHTKPPEIEKALGQLKQRYTSTYVKLRIGRLRPGGKKWWVKYEAAAFGGSVIAEASNARKLRQAMEEAKGGKKGGMVEVRYS